MRLLLLLLLLVSSACEAQSVLGTKVTLTKQAGTAGELLNELDSLPGIDLSFSSEVVDLSRKIKLAGNELTVEDLLKAILKDQPVRYLEQNGKIFLVAEQPIKKKFTISGYISDKASGERLIGASFFIVSKKQGTTSNAYGFFSLTLEEDTIQLLVTHSAYIAQSFNIDLHQDVVLNVTLDPRLVINEMVVVNAESRANAQNRTLPGRMNIPSSMIKSMPALMGEADLLKTLQLLPGIQAGNEGTSGLNVRGGSPDQNLVLLDGVPVYNASHAFGLFSIFNADAVHDVEVLKGGFPASYGGRLSSVIDVHLKEGDKYKMHGEGGVGFIFSKLTLEGPLKTGKSSFLVSIRRTYADLLLRPIIKKSDGVILRTYFSDIIAKTNFPVGKSDRVYFSIYLGKDKYITEDHFADVSQIYQSYKTGFSWGNVTAMTRLNHEYSKRLFSNLTFNYSRFRFYALNNSTVTKEGTNFPQIYEQKDFSAVQDIDLKYDIDFLPSPNHFVKFGAVATLHHYRPGVRDLFLKDTIVKVNQRIDSRSVYAGEYDVYAEDDIRISSRLKANVGIRFGAFNVSNTFFFSAQPRLNFLYRFNNKWSLKASAVKMNQYIHLLTNSNMGLPTDLWVPVTKKIPPQRSYQVSAGISYNHDKSLEASMEVYYKDLKNVIEYAEGAGFSAAYTSWEDMVDLGKGRAYGTEWLVQKRKGKLTGLVSYTLSWSDRKFETINQGRRFPYKYDRRHEAKLALVWAASKKFEMACDWVFSTGNAISLPVSWYYDPGNGSTIDIYTGRNNYRMPDYHRMDVSMKFIKQKKNYQRTWVLGVYNVYNHLNPFYIYKYYKYDDQGRYISAFKQVALFPILPSLTYQFKF